MNYYLIVLLNDFSTDITDWNISDRNINGNLDVIKFNKVTKLKCKNCKITRLLNLPNSLILDCYYNELIELNNLPDGLKFLNCSFNKITELDNLPNTLIELNCYSNKIKQLNNLPNGIIMLEYGSNKIKYLNKLPNSLEFIDY